MIRIYEHASFLHPQGTDSAHGCCRGRSTAQLSVDVAPPQTRPSAFSVRFFARADHGVSGTLVFVSAERRGLGGKRRSLSSCLPVVGAPSAVARLVFHGGPGRLRQLCGRGGRPCTRRALLLSSPILIFHSSLSFLIDATPWGAAFPPRPETAPCA